MDWMDWMDWMDSLARGDFGVQFTKLVQKKRSVKGKAVTVHPDRCPQSESTLRPSSTVGEHTRSPAYSCFGGAGLDWSRVGGGGGGGGTGIVGSVRSTAC